MSKYRQPEQGEIQIVVLLGEAVFTAWTPREQAVAHMDSFEARSKFTVEDRADQHVHGAIRAEITRLLRGPDAERLYGDVLASGVLWLALRHWSASEEVERGIATEFEKTGYAILTASIPDETPPGVHPDTAWSFMVGSTVHDGRARLAKAPPGKVFVIDAKGRIVNPS